MNFEQALGQLKRGDRLNRRDWDNKMVFIYLVESTQVWKDHLRGRCKEAVAFVDSKDTHTSDTVFIREHIDMIDAEGFIVVGWVPSQTDLIAEDWQILKK